MAWLGTELCVVTTSVFSFLFPALQAFVLPTGSVVVAINRHQRGVSGFKDRGVSLA